MTVRELVIVVLLTLFVFHSTLNQSRLDSMVFIPDFPSITNGIMTIRESA